MTITASIPDGISAISTLEKNKVQVSWLPADNNPFSYNIYRSSSAYYGFVQVGTTDGLTYVDTPPFGAPNFDNLWYYRVTSVNITGESGQSGPFTFVNYSAFDHKPTPHLSWSNLL